MAYKIEKNPNNIIEPSIEDKGLCELLDKSYTNDVSNQWEEKSFNWFDGISTPKHDFIFIYGTIPTCNEKVKNVLEVFPNINNTQFLPIIIEGERYFIISTQNVEKDVLNRRKSKIIFDKNKTIMWVKKYAPLSRQWRSCRAWRRHTPPTMA